MDDIKNILIIRLRFMGDVILTTPLLSSLKDAYPNALITYLAETPYADLLKDHPAVNDILTLDKTNRKQTARLYKKVDTKAFLIPLLRKSAKRGYHK